MDKLIIDLHAKMTQRRMEAINAEVMAVYDEIWSLKPELQSAALQSWYEYCESICTPENLCIECLRERGV